VNWLHRRAYWLAGRDDKLLLDLIPAQNFSARTTIGLPDASKPVLLKSDRRKDCKASGGEDYVVDNFRDPSGSVVSRTCQLVHAGRVHPHTFSFGAGGADPAIGHGPQVCSLKR
jgi:hypothetical protein